MNLEEVNKLLDAGFSAAFIERILTQETPAAPTAPTAPEVSAAPEAPAAPVAQEAPAAPVAPEAQAAPTNSDLAEINRKIAELIGAVQQHNILTISRETPPQSPGEIAEAYLTNLINGGEKK